VLPRMTFTPNSFSRRCEVKCSATVKIFLKSNKNLCIIETFYYLYVVVLPRNMIKNISQYWGTYIFLINCAFSVNLYPTLCMWGQVDIGRIQGAVHVHSFISVSGLWFRGSFRPLNCMETFTPFLAYFGDVFFSLFTIIWGHSVTASWS
jgi:hypothetical protein